VRGCEDGNDPIVRIQPNITSHISQQNNIGKTMGSGPDRRKIWLLNTNANRSIDNYTVGKVVPKKSLLL
jgi:hypothetical protein